MTGTSDIRGGAATERYGPYGETGRTRWVGWVVFAGVMMFMLGCFEVIAALVAIFDDEYYLVESSGLVVRVDFTAWGWLHLAIGAVIIAAAVGVLTGRMWARVVGIVVAVLSALANMAFIAAYPVWSVLIIALDVIVVYALAMHGGELRTPDD
jgi:hypothetical protein